MRKNFIVEFLFLIFISFGLNSEIFDHSTNKTIKIPTFIHFKSKPLLNDTYRLVAGTNSASNISTCDKLNPSDFGPNFSFNDSAVVVFGYNRCSFLRHTKLIEEVGGKVAIIAAGIPFVDTVFRFGIEDAEIPILFVFFPDAGAMLQIIGKNAALGFPTFVKIKNEENTWANLGKGGFFIFIEVICFVFYTFNYILGIRSLILHYKEEGLKLTFAQSSIWVNLISTFIASMFVFDPWNFRYIASNKFAAAMICILPPALLTSVLFLSFFFNEILIAKGFMKPQLTTLKYPFIIICLTFWAAYIADAIYLGTDDVRVIVIKTVGMMSCLFFGLTGVYYLCVVTLILLRLKTFKSPLLKRITPLVVTVFFGIVLFVIGAIIEVNQSFNTSYQRRKFVVWTLYLISSIFILTPPFVFFREPKSKTPKPSSEKQFSSNKQTI